MKRTDKQAKKTLCPILSKPIPTCNEVDQQWTMAWEDCQGSECAWWIKDGIDINDDGLTEDTGYCGAIK